MPTIDTRHAERNHLFSLYEAQITGDIEAQIDRLEAIMDQEDVDKVLEKVEKRKAKANR